MGMIVYVHRDVLGDCTNGGISSKADRLTVVNVEGPFEPCERAPAARLEAHLPGCLRIVPEGVNRWTMFGGNFAATSDSRFARACDKLVGGRFYGAVAIHDRIEG